MRTRLMSWEDYGIYNHKEVLAEIRAKAQGDIKYQLSVLEQCIATYPGISSYLYESIVHKKSYDSMYVCIKKDDFYAYRRKAVARIVQSGDKKTKK